MGADRVESLLEELVSWTKVQALPAAKQALEGALAKDEHRKVYQASVGGSSADIAKLTGVSDFTVRAVWKKCYRLGLMREDPATKGRYLRAFDLEDFEMLPGGSK